MTQDLTVLRPNQTTLPTEQLTRLTSPFDKGRLVRDGGNEYWTARETQNSLGYGSWRKFKRSIERAIICCEVNGDSQADHFVRADKMVSLGSGAERQIEDYQLSRLAMYLVAMNSDPHKPQIAAAQKYFAVRTRQAEIARVEVQRVVERLATVEGQLQEIQQGRTEARTQLQYIERSERSAPEKPLRARLNELVRLYCQTNTESYAGVWNMLYKELYYRCHTDVRARAKKNNLLPLDEADRAGLLENLYAIASEILV